MTHTIKWSRVGWMVVSSIGAQTVACYMATSYMDALFALASVTGNR